MISVKYKWLVGLSALLIVVGVILFGVSSASKSGRSDDREVIETKEVDISDADRALVERDQALVLAAIEAQEALGEGHLSLGLYRDAAANAQLVGDLATAREQLETYLDHNSLNYSVWRQYAGVLEDMNEIKLAEAAYLESIENGGGEQEVMALIKLWREHYTHEEKSQQIKTVLDATNAALGQTPAVLIELGQWYLAEGNCEEAIAHYEVLVDLIPDNENAASDLESVKSQCSTM